MNENGSEGRAENTAGTGSHWKVKYKNKRSISDVAETLLQLKAELNVKYVIKLDNTELMGQIHLEESQWSREINKKDQENKGMCT